MGRSVIPVYGDLDPLRAKVPTLEWLLYQRRKAIESEVERWCSQGRCGGIAIVTGHISGVYILDCDTLDEYQRFGSEYPDLALTHIVQTRRGFHLYFHVPAHLNLPSRRGNGVDLLGNGRYAVLPPTIIDGFQYHIVRGGMPKTLNQHDIARILAFVDSTHAVVSLPVQIENTKPVSTPLPAAQSLTIYDLQALYRLIASQQGRNIALFSVAVRARDAGWLRSQVEAAFTDLHIQQSTARTHRTEQPQQRQREAEATIRSAFSRPARPQKQTHQQGTLPNNVREKLLHLKLTPALRTLEALYLAGVQPGQTITERQVLTLLAGQVGRHSIRIALSACLPDGQPLFAPAQKPVLNSKNPSPRTPTPANAAADPGYSPTKKMPLVRVTKPDKNTTGRPARRFIVPSGYELCQRLGVKPQRRDPLQIDDLTSARRYRQALQREFIQRSPGPYPRRWLAGRLAVSVRTLQRYHTAIPVQVLPQFEQRVITWHNLDHVPADDADAAYGGMFLEADGKRYPPKQSIARRLLSREKWVLYKRQLVNYYWIGEPTQPPDMVVRAEIEPVYTQLETRVERQQRRAAEQKQLHDDITRKRQRLLERVTQTPPVQPPVTETHHPTLTYSRVITIPTATQPARPKSVQWQPSPRKPKRSKRYYRRPLLDERMESMAKRVYEAVNGLAQTADQRLSLVNARKWIDEYGSNAIGSALKLLKQRRNVYQPAGFMKTVLRSQAKQRR